MPLMFSSNFEALASEYLEDIEVCWYVPQTAAYHKLSILLFLFKLRSSYRKS